MPLQPRAWICVDPIGEKTIEGKSYLRLTPECAVETEIDYYIETLKQDLNAVGAEAKMQFKYRESFKTG